ncbi:hypothetical protein FACS1894198_1090 [Clostridia bacterium]|nr:hypothetical protein FACS1894198_1090 [Clostridia bacterium]
MLRKFAKRLFLLLVLLILGIIGSTGIQTFARDEDDYDYDDDTAYAEDANYDEDDDSGDDDQSASNDDNSSNDSDDEYDDGDDEDGGNKKKSASEKKREALEKELDELKNEEKKLKSERKKAEENKKHVEYRQSEEKKKKGTIETEIEALRREVNLLESKRQLLEKEIGKRKIDIEEREKNVQAEHDLLAKRFKSMYVSGKTQAGETLGLLLGADDYYSALTKVEFDKRLMKQNQQLVDRIRKQKERVEKEKEKLEISKKDLEETKKKLEANKKKLEADNVAVDKVMYNLALQRAAYEGDIERCEREKKEYQREISEIYKKLHPSTGKYIGGEFAWPVPGYREISSQYGWRDWDTSPHRDFHQGVDIAGSKIYGKNVVAANGGKVLFICHSGEDKRYGSYGKYVRIDHGGGISTIYGHLSAINVSLDQEIAKEEKIGEVGSTGFSTGPHLHFEVRENDKHVNPMKYLGKRKNKNEEEDNNGNEEGDNKSEEEDNKKKSDSPSLT